MKETTNHRFSKSLFIFRRDLRVEDNLGLIKAVNESTSIIPCFIFDPRQVEHNPFKSHNAIQFMLESLLDLEQQIKSLNGKLFFFHGKSDDIIKQIIKEEKINAIFCNKDYTPFSSKRDQEIKKICDSFRVHFEQSADVLLNEPEIVKTGKGTPYSKFTPFFNYSGSAFSVQKPKQIKTVGWFTKKITHEQNVKIFKTFLRQLNPEIKVHGGTNKAHLILDQISKYKNYAKQHDFPALDSTTHLSAHLKFGTVSVRQVFHAMVKQLGIHHPLIRQLYWRDFFLSCCL